MIKLIKQAFSLKTNWSGGGDDVSSQQPVVRDRCAWETCSSQEVPKHWLSIYQWEKSLLLMLRQRPSQRAPVNTDEINELAQGRKYSRQAMSPPLHLYITILKAIHMWKVASKFLVVITLFSGSAAIAKDSPVSTNNTRFSSSAFTDSSSSISQEQLSNMFGVSIEEWHEYKRELQGPRGLWSPNLHPLLVLGMKEGITESERRRLARRYARIQYERTQRELAMDNAVREAALEMYPQVPLFKKSSTTNLIPSLNRQNTVIQQRYDYYVAASCQTSCKDQIQKWIDQGQPFNLFVVDANKKTIVRFAKKMGISPLLVPRQIKLIPLSKKELASRGIAFRKLPVIRHSKVSLP